MALEGGRAVGRICCFAVMYSTKGIQIHLYVKSRVCPQDALCTLLMAPAAQQCWYVYSPLVLFVDHL